MSYIQLKLNPIPCHKRNSIVQNNIFEYKMGCMTSIETNEKSANSPETSVKSTVSLKCGICHNLYDLYELKPKMLECRHTICGICLDKIKASTQSECPFDHRPIDPKLYVGDSRLVMAELFSLKSPGRPLSFPRCKCGALMLAIPRFKEECFICTNPFTIVSCIACSYVLCKNCFNLDFSGTICPCGATLEDTQQKKECSRCFAPQRTGVSCTFCELHLCYFCRPQTIKGLDPCPCGGTMIPNKKSHYCFGCKFIYRGSKCENCAYHLCISCYTPKVPAYMCRCWGIMQSTQTIDYCTKCRQQGVGAKCNDCRAHVCYSCYKPAYSGGKCLCGKLMANTTSSYFCSWCGKERSGLKCEGCGFHLCSLCFEPQQQLQLDFINLIRFIMNRFSGLLVPNSHSDMTF
eukprot:TRINITY_DN13490_c0_g1_i1.p1 TRINITY_DN13490_c0_g1~~TRINITY_DN13490_c0_g1_i1.p1  ORF type:complete len:404 (+),score=-22.16 TRINITY_DN13490_c0_g1_i1:96-1307(+)